MLSREVMIEAPFAIIADILIPLVSGAIEISVLVLLASVRPWYYLLSPTFRTTTNQQYASRSVLAKAFFLFWGTLAVLGSLAVLLGAFWFFSSTAEPKRPTTTEVSRELHRALEGVLKNK